MKILVTGGAGYLGAVLVPMLLADGHAVTVVDNFLYGQVSLLDVCHDPHLTVIRGDARDINLMSVYVRKADVILPLACLTGMPACARDTTAARTVNLDAVKLFVVLASTSQPVLFPSTNSGYGTGGLGVPCTEESPVAPVSLYGRLKMDAERLLLEGQPNAIVFRFATAFGVSPRMRLDLLVNDFVYRAVTDRFVMVYEGHFMRNYIHVRDMAHAFRHALARLSSMAGQIYNVGRDDANCSKLELCQHIQRHVPDFVFRVAGIGRDPDQRNYVVSNAKILATGFVPSLSLDDGIRELMAGYQIVRRTQFGNAA